MLTGQKPFEAEDYHGWAQQHMNTAPEPPSGLRPDLASWKGLDALVLRMLAKERDQRPKDTAELLQLIDAVAYVPPRTVREKPLNGGSERKVKFTRRIPRWMWAVGAAVLVLAATSTILLLTPKLAIQWGDAIYGDPHKGRPRGPNIGSEFLYRLACAGGSGDACAKLANSYAIRFGVGDPKTVAAASKAVALFTKACDAGDGKSCMAVGQAYNYGFPNGTDYARAFTLYTKACVGGIADACDKLGTLYYDGHGVAINYTRAVALFEKACGVSSAWGCADLGGSYRNGRGVSQDLDKAKQLSSKACSMGASIACDN
jgi:hypothetical protein